ncbi:transferase [Paenibacillus sp. FSL H8-0548]|uniref:acetyltransferase n=1 Tax=Paenibacillus sp. FSL H8-0548 TaxID=1920422 RepID=UPI00096D8401|nr:acetyltransferase [Paenibacillus sp. FSL H8-0548]OMF35947.1 transferase [Paenibacillus sp. FSL H8-0548]
MKNIVVYGAGGHAKAVIDTIEKAGVYHIIGLLDGYKTAGTLFYGYTILGDESWLAANAEAVFGGIVAIGDNWLRARVVSKITAIAPHFTFVSAIHPTSSIARGARIGAGTVVMAGCVVNSDTAIGEHNVLYTHASADHDSTLGNYVTLAPKAGTGGTVTIGDFSVVSLGATIIHGKSIGEHTIVGAGSTVLGDIPAYSIAYGTPAKVIRTRIKGERYL